MAGGWEGMTSEWMSWKNCGDTDPEIFFPEQGGSAEWARIICGRCAVEAECLEWALARDERFGIWGGKTEHERRRLKRRGL